MNTDQTTAVAETPSRKWTSTAGPIQTKRVNKALSDISWEGRTTTTKNGIVGGEEHEHSSTVLFGACRPETGAALTAIAERFDYTVTRENCAEIVVAAEAALIELRKSRPIIDERKTLEQIKARDEENARIQQEIDAREAAKDAAFLAVFGQIGEKVSVEAGKVGIVAVLTYDNSHAMSDYFDSHATIGCKLLLGTAVKQAQTQGLARHFVSLYPELSGVEFEWHTEKYSGGHGNYLRAKGCVDMPPEVGASVSRYGSSETVTAGRWEIQFNGWEKQLHTFKGYPGTFAHHPVADPVDQSISQAGIIVRKNEVHNGVEIIFPGKPAPEVIARCKAAGFRWSFHSKCWYKKFGAYAWAQAHTIAGLPLPGERDPGATTIPVEQSQGVDRFDAMIQDQAAEACGLRNEQEQFA